MTVLARNMAVSPSGSGGERARRLVGDEVLELHVRVGEPARIERRARLDEPARVADVGAEVERRGEAHASFAQAERHGAAGARIAAPGDLEPRLGDAGHLDVA